MMFNRFDLFMVFYLLQSVVHAANVSIHKNETSGLLTWTLQDNGFKLELIQLLPDFVRAIYSKHNYPKSEVERVASYCVFGTILNNTSNQVMSYDVREWKYVTKDEKQHDVKTKTQWLKEWEKAGINFSWTLLPDKGDFEVGDWQQGFTTIQLAPESEFDLLYKWKLDGRAYEGVLKGLKCAPVELS